ncbi:unnamed protein product [Protopolystoma xenopodis]|uniref:Uncharacterized protein n=1 Tax=Protopolystoma xenopodis TaxID=117903 RepID=A0A448X037_9PLAT|nr:unnamed protein product [Protopolystoma xenopodis]
MRGLKSVSRPRQPSPKPPGLWAVEECDFIFSAQSSDERHFHLSHRKLALNHYQTGPVDTNHLAHSFVNLEQLDDAFVHRLGPSPKRIRLKSG